MPTLGPGYFSRQLAIPWQTDFFACFEGGDDEHPPATETNPVGWWPHQRPAHVFRAGTVRGIVGPQNWHRGPWGDDPSNQQMVDNWSKFGFVIKQENGKFLETERSPSLGR